MYLKNLDAVPPTSRREACGSESGRIGDGVRRVRFREPETSAAEEGNEYPENIFLPTRSQRLRDELDRATRSFFFHFPVFSLEPGGRKSAVPENASLPKGNESLRSGLGWDDVRYRASRRSLGRPSAAAKKNAVQINRTVQNIFLSETQDLSLQEFSDSEDLAPERASLPANKNTSSALLGCQLIGGLRDKPSSEPLLDNILTQASAPMLAQILADINGTTVVICDPSNENQKVQEFKPKNCEPEQRRVLILHDSENGRYKALVYSQEVEAEGRAEDSLLRAFLMSQHYLTRDKLNEQAIKNLGAHIQVSTLSEVLGVPIHVSCYDNLDSSKVSKRYHCYPSNSDSNAQSLEIQFNKERANSFMGLVNGDPVPSAGPCGDIYENARQAVLIALHGITSGRPGRLLCNGLLYKIRAFLRNAS